MKILITGHKGFIGSNLYAHFSQTEHQVHGYEWGERFPGYNFDLVMHIGAISSTIERDIEKIMRQNYDFTVNLLENCNDRGIPVQFSSSASLYGNNTQFSEDSPLDPKTPYAWSKYLVERYVSTRNWSIPIQIFRYFNVYGPGEEHKGNQASPQHKFRKQFKERGYIELFKGSENFYRDFIHVNTIVGYHEKFMNISESGIWNFGTGKCKSFVDVANEISAEHRYIDMPENLKYGYQFYTCADITKLTKILKKYEKNIDSNAMS